ncbi:MAG: metallophosphoesterase [Acidobacteria bacterium]|nr:metallophosphoesterase [Acidobacteriota bacterium]
MNRRQALFSLAAMGATALFKSASLLNFNDSKALLRFAVIGDWGTGDRTEGELAKTMFETHQRDPFEFILTVGDNIYPDGKPEHFVKKFEKPFEALLRAQVPFYATLGNHDVEGGRQAQVAYPLFHMNGESYYQLSKANGLIEAFMIDSTAFNERQRSWLEAALKSSTAKWKVACFHHPLYSSGKKHGSQDDLRKLLEPLLMNYGVKVVFSGHDHFYERLKVKNDIQYFVTGAGGSLRRGGLNQHSGLTAASYDQDNHFMVIEMNETEISFRAINRIGDIVDKGLLQKTPAAVVGAMAGF